MKRLIDVIVAGTALLLLAPVIAVVTLAIRIRLGSPVLFRQERPGRGGKPFELVKFRTMSDARDGQGVLQPDDCRLDRLGRFLRATSLDELPQLVNVMTGAMSLVGPRPLLTRYLNRYTAEQMRRHDVRPGLTGWAQVNGRNAISWSEKFALDLWYVDNHSLLLDLKIIAITIMKVAGRRGITAVGSATMTEFMGSPEEQSQPVSDGG